MARVTITIRPTVSDERLLGVTDAMQQVLDSIKIFEDARRGVGNPHEDFVWKLERASTNTPFTVVAIAEGIDPAIDVSENVNRVQAAIADGIRSVVQRETPPAWMTPNTVAATRNIFARNLNGIGETDYDLERGRIIAIRPPEASSGINTLEAFNVMAFREDLPARDSYGQIEGVMLAAGRYRNKEAIQIRNELYGYIWCVLSQETIDSFGSEHEMRDVWAGKTLGVRGVLHYAQGGAKITHIEAARVREIEAAPRVNLEEILDPDFTAGMDPHEYLEKLHEGSLG